jgi:hypothetical protein
MKKVSWRAIASSSVRELAMFVRNAADASPRPNSLRELGMTSDSNPIISLNEFTYKKGTEIYGEKEPADYVYQVKLGAVRSYKLLSDGRRQIGATPQLDWSGGKASNSSPKATRWLLATC